jgi:hypothetical protein
MRFAFDLFDYSDLADHTDAMVAALQSGKMPCDGA